MTDRLTPAMRVEVLELIWNYRSTPGNTLVRYIAELRDEAARREAEQEGSLECPACGGSGHIDDFKARREAEGGIPADHLQHAVETDPLDAYGREFAAMTPDAPPPRREAEADDDRNRVPAPIKVVETVTMNYTDAPPPPAPFVTDHKWLDPECHASGCQTLILKAELEKLRDQRDKYVWQVRDTCRRAEAAEAREKRLREALELVLPLAKSHVAKHDYESSRTYLAIAESALAQGGNDV